MNIFPAIISKLTKIFFVLLVLLLVGVGSVSATTYYSNTNGDPASTNQWWTGTNGTGSHPPNFTTAGDVFTIQNGDAMTTGSGGWTVTGTVIINSGGNLIRGTYNITCGGLVINGTSTNSNGNSFTVNGSVSGTGTITAGGTPRIFNVTGDWTFNGAVTNGDAISVTMNGTGNQTLSGVIANAGTAGALIVNKTSGIVTLGSNITTGSTSGGAFTLTAGTFDPATYIITFNATSSNFYAGTLRVGAATWSNNYSAAISEPAGGTIEYYASGNQTVNNVNYPGNLTLMGSGTKTLQTGTTSIGGNLNLSGTATTTTVAGLTISGNLNIGNGTTFTAAGYALTVTGTTIVGGGISGSLIITSATGAKLFTGLVTIAAGATWNNSGNSALQFRGGITTTPVFNGGSGVHTFTTSPQALTGTFTIPNVTVTTITLTNNNILTVGTALSGTGGLTQSAGATLNIGTASAITTLTATNTGNTVNYIGSGLTVHSNNYYNLTLNGGGTDVLQSGTSSIGGNLTIDNTTTTAVAALTIGGDVILNNGFNFSGGAFTHNVAGNWTRNGWNNYDPGTGTINFTGNNSAINGTQTTQTFNNITIAKTAGQTLSVGGSMANLNLTGNMTLSSGAFAQGTIPTVVSGNWTNNGGSLTSGTGIITMNGAGKTIGGTSSTTFNNLTITASGMLLGVDQFVNGTLILNNGVLSLGAFNLTMGASSPAIVGGPWTWNGNMIVAVGSGQLRKVFTGIGSYVFPIGDASTVSPMTLNFTQGTFDTGAYAGVNVTKSKHPQNTSPNYLNRYWSVSQSGIHSFLCNVIGTYVYADLVGSEGVQNAAEFPGYYPWLNYSTLSGYTLTANGVSTFGDFTGMGLPTLNTSVSTLDGFSYIHYYGPSDPPKQFTVTAQNLSNNVVVTAPTDFEVSTTYTGGYGSSVPLTPTSAGVVNSTIYVHLKAGLAIGNYSNENIVCSTTGLSPVNILLTNATITAPSVCAPTGDASGYGITLVKFGTINNVSAKPAGYTDYTSTQSTNLIVGSTYQLTVNVNTNGNNTVGAKVWIDWNNGGFTYNSGYVAYDLGTVTNTSNGKTSLCPLSITVPAGASIGNLRMRVACLNGSSPYNACDNNSEVEDYTLNIINPVITVSAATLTGFKYADGNGPSNEMSFTVTGTGLADDIIVTPPANYEISTLSGGIFQSTALTLTKTGTNVSATIYVRLKAGLTTGSYGPDPQYVSLTSTSATTKNVNCSGTVVPGVIAAGGGSYCASQTINLTATATNYSNLYWEGPNNFYSLNNLTPSISPTLTSAMVGDYKVTASFIIGSNLVVNGDFETTGTQPVSFTSDYIYKDPSCTTCGTYGPLSDAGTYSISANTSDVHTLFGSYKDHSTTGKQLIVNGATTANVKVWSQTVAVTPNSSYQFTYWVQSANPTDPAPSQLQLIVNNVSAGPTYTANATGGNWKQFLYNWNSGSNTSATLSLVNKQTVGGGNDFGLDDIVFQQICTSSATTNVSVIITPIPAVVTVTASANPVSLGTSVTFTAAPTNGGLSPSYQWSVGGTAVTGATGTTYTYVPANGDVVACTMTSNSACLTGSTSVSSSVTMTVTARTNYWKGTTSTVWSTVSNWTNNVPASGDDVVFSTSSTSYGDAVNNLILDGDKTIGKLINQSTKQLIIPPAKCLTVNGAITTDGVASRIYIQAYPDGSQQNGSLIFYTSSSVYGTVEMYSKASMNLSGTKDVSIFNWQYFGIPVVQVIASPTFDGSYVRKWDETGKAINTHWVQLGNSDQLDQFIGYEICQTNPSIIIFKGQLVNTNYSSGKLSVSYFGTGNANNALFPGQYVLANPYTTGIDIRKIVFGDDAQATVYLYNTGTFGAWTAAGGVIPVGANDAGGQYISIPQSTAGNPGLPVQIPSMQAMMIRPKDITATNSNYSVTINYTDVVMKNSTLQRISGTSGVSSSDKVLTMIDVKGEHASDRMWLFTNSSCTHTFDNGWDGNKISGSALNPQLYAVEEDGNYQVDAVNDMNNTELAFQAGEDSEYTLTFTQQNIENSYAGVYLVDLSENKTIDITANGTEYTFTAETTSAPVKRFKIVTRPYEKNTSDTDTQVKLFSSQSSVFVQNYSSLDGECIVYDIAGHYITKVPFVANGVTSVINSLRPGAYVATAVTATEKISKRLIVQ
jgi:hypothetical protein